MTVMPSCACSRLTSTAPLTIVCATLQEGTAFFPGSSLAGNGLLVSDGAVWQRQRQLTNPGFRKAAVETYAAVRPIHLHLDCNAADVAACVRRMWLLFTCQWFKSCGCWQCHARQALLLILRCCFRINGNVHDTPHVSVVIG